AAACGTTWRGKRRSSRSSPRARSSRFRAASPRIPLTSWRCATSRGSRFSWPTGATTDSRWSTPGSSSPDANSYRAMPLFDYHCKKCGHEFEALVRRDETPACEKCGSKDLQKLLSVPYVKGETSHAKAMKAAKARDKKQADAQNDAQRRYELSHDD